MNYYSVSPLKDYHGRVIGTNLQRIIWVNLNGSIPDYYVKRVSRKHQKHIFKQIDYLLQN